MAINYGVAGVRELITGTRLSVIEFPAPTASQLNRLYMRIAAANTNGDTLFDVKKNGVSIYGSPTDRPKILSGQTTSQSFPTVSLAEGDMITVDVVAAPLGGITGLYVLVQLQDSPTVAQYIKDAYVGAYNRQPTAPELASATTALQTGCGANTTLAATKTFFDGIFTAAEYTALATSNDTYIEDLYQSILGRPSDPGGKSYWLTNLAGSTRQAVRDAFNTIGEHINNRVLPWCPNTLMGANALQLQGKGIAATAPTNGQILKYNNATGLYEPATPASATVVDEVFNTEDDGFDSASLNAKWTQALGGGTLPTIAINPVYARSCYVAKMLGSAFGTVSLSQSFAPAGDFSLTAKLYYRGTTSTSIIDVVVTNAGATAQIGMRVRQTGTDSAEIVVLDEAAFLYLSGAKDLPAFTTALYFHFQRVGSTWTFLHSNNGVAWRQVYTGSKSITVALIKILLGQYAATATKEFLAIDWVRRDWFFWP